MMQILNRNFLLVFLAIIAVGGIAVTIATTDVQSTKGTSDLKLANATFTPDLVTGPLDGKTFTGALGPDGKPKDVKDVFVFENGTFVSKECEVRCKYPARPYFVRTNGTKTEFLSETQCPYKDAKIVWRGIVDGDTVKGKSTWVAKRWYWTVEKTFEFEGKLVEEPIATASIK
jgi:hypothetical protein